MSPDFAPPIRKPRDQVLRDGLGVVSEAFSPIGVGATAAPATQTVYGLAVGLRVGDVASGVMLRNNTAAAGTAPTVARVGLATSAGVVLIRSNDLGAASNWTAGGPRFAFTADYVITTEGVYYSLFVVNGTWGSTQPALGRGGNGFATGLIAATGGVMPAFLWSSQTDLPAVSSSVTISTGSSPVFYQGIYGTAAA